MEPALVLLNIELHLRPRDLQRFVTHIFIAARATIASHLKQVRPPVFSEVLARLNEQVTFERLFASVILRRLWFP